ncbi:MAG: hypothetical protein ACWA44_08740 [Thiotrichales bacterium]
MTLNQMETRLAALAVQYDNNTTPAERRALQSQMLRLQRERAMSWSKEDWLAAVEVALDSLGARVARWVSKY